MSKTKAIPLAHLTDDTSAPAPRRARGAAFYCERCQREHPPILYPDVEGGYAAAKSKELRAQWDAAYAFKSHKSYATGTDGAHAIKVLRELVKPGATVYTSVERPSIARKVKLFVVVDGAIQNITGLAATAGVGSWDDKHGALSYGGYGYSAGFQAVYDLGRMLFADVGFKCVGRACPSNDHSNGDRDYTPGKLHSDAGYALRQGSL